MSKLAKKIHLFSRVFLVALFGVVLGIVVGLVFGALISFISTLFASGSYDSPPLGFGVFMGMGAGAIIGGIMGAIAGMRK